MALLITSFSIAQQNNTPPLSGFPKSTIQNNSLLTERKVYDNSISQTVVPKEIETKINNEILNYQHRLNQDTIFLPVVFHIINNDPSSISDKYITDGLQELNEAFSKTGRYADSKGADTKIRFCIAQKDPDGGNTTGITRTKSFFSTDLSIKIEDDKLRNLIVWDPSKYINIWLVTNIKVPGASFECGKWKRGNVTSGYLAHSLWGDGIVLTSFGKLLITLTAQYLSLYSTYYNYPNCTNYDCSTNGDMVCDTPPEYYASTSSTCSNTINTCSTDTLSNYSNGNFFTDVPDQTTNFMGKGAAACKNEFTQGQADRMIADIFTQRKGLLENDCNKPCAENITAVFDRNNAYPTTGDVVNFTNNSTGAANYQWLVNDVVVSSNTNFIYTCTTPGKFKISLKAYNNISCYAMFSQFVIVNCGVTARFYGDKDFIASKISLYEDSISFTNISVNASSYKWMMSNDKGMDEQLVSTSKDLVYVFSVPANYRLRLIAINGNCTDTSNVYQIYNQDPTQDGAAWINTINCYQQTKVRITLGICNNGYAPIPPGTPITFYDADPRLGNANRLAPNFYMPDNVNGKCCSKLYTHIIDVKYPGLDRLFMVFNDSGNTMPLRLPNTILTENNYENNVSVSANFRFKSAIFPTQATLEPGDTLQLFAQAGPGSIKSYLWSTDKIMSCTDCIAPLLIADSSRTKRMIATSDYGCIDTAFIDIKVPPANDYTANFNDIKCAANNKFYVNFTLFNKFKRGVIPQGLTVSFYDGDPQTTAALLLPPVFLVPDTIFAKQSTFSHFVNGNSLKKIYMVVNYNGQTIPVQLPGNGNLLEKDYSNNIASYIYDQETIPIQPQDTTVFKSSSFYLKINVPVYNPQTTNWISGNGYSLSCNNCESPAVKVFNNSLVTVQTENKYGCVIKGTSVLKIFPPDLTVEILETNCYTNSTTMVTFKVCMNNKYDSVYPGIPISFYDASYNGSQSKLLLPVFYTPVLQAGNCFTYRHIIATPTANKLFAVVNDKGINPGGEPATVFNETNYDNNIHNIGIKKFKAFVTPADTAIARLGSVQLSAQVQGGTLSYYLWRNDPFMSCLYCLTPVVTPTYSHEYMFIAQNEFSCFDTAQAIVKTFTGGVMNIPTAFTPNHDGLNDIFYILSGAGISFIKDFTIFDRWGAKVFQSRNFLPNDPRYGWDGTNKGIESAPGTYIYVITISDENKKDRIYKGNISLIR